MNGRVISKEVFKQADTNHSLWRTIFKGQDHPYLLLSRVSIHIGLGKAN